jgi:hypothetical protein
MKADYAECKPAERPGNLPGGLTTEPIVRTGTDFSSMQDTKMIKIVPLEESWGS